ncbi:unnamed protein product [Rhizophagus irregularis]|nr:unnamed protein product [Rhizophagus irregularis]CAB4404537.1 unnamed protein product [Rhizophagus irregularis]
MKYQEDQNQINQVDNDENNEIDIHYALINEKNKFKIILATPGLEKSAFITNNLPFGKFAINLTLRQV